jgi:hypothetical protein
MATTPNGLPYPLSTATPDVPRDIKALAEALDVRVADPDLHLYTPSHNMGADVSSTAGLWYGVGRLIYVAVKAVIARPITAPILPGFRLPVDAITSPAAGFAFGRFLSAGVNDWHGGASVNGQWLVMQAIATTNHESAQIHATMPITWKAGDELLASAVYLSVPR